MRTSGREWLDRKITLGVAIDEDHAEMEMQAMKNALERGVETMPVYNSGVRDQSMGIFRQSEEAAERD